VFASARPLTDAIRHVDVDLVLIEDRGPICQLVAAILLRPDVLVPQAFA
jgi:hypothetical protein